MSGYRWALVFSLIVLTAVVASAQSKKSEKWLGDETPLPLVVKNPQDLAFKQVTEREYLVFNLLASGKLAWDSGRYADAAEAWETLLTLPNLDREIDKVVRPLAIEARTKGGAASTLSPVTPPAPAKEAAPEAAPKKVSARGLQDVAGVITGGGSAGPGGAVVALRRVDGKTPKPSSTGEFSVAQTGKQFVPRVLAVPVGATVSFRNDDAIFHNVFSLSSQNEFDLGLYKSGLAKTRTFAQPGPVQLFCNIHAQMNGWVVVLDTPWYAVADGNGRWAVRNVPAGEYNVEVWHEASSQLTKAVASVSPSMAPLSFVVSGDRRAPAFPPDKYGKARQVQLGY